MYAHLTVSKIDIQNDRGNGREQDFVPVRIPHYVDIVRARLNDVCQYAQFTAFGL